MARRLISLFAFSFLCIACASLAQAATSAELALARAEVELARQRLWQFDQVEYPLELRRLNDAIEFAEAEIETIEFRLAEYEPYTRTLYGSPLVTTLQDLRMAHLAAQQRYRQLREERMLLVRLRPAQRATLMAEIAAAEAVLAELSR